MDANISEAINKPSLSFWQDAWFRIRKNKAAIVSIVHFGFHHYHGFCWSND